MPKHIHKKKAFLDLYFNCGPPVVLTKWRKARYIIGFIFLMLLMIIMTWLLVLFYLYTIVQFYMVDPLTRSWEKLRPQWVRYIIFLPGFIILVTLLTLLAFILIYASIPLAVVFVIPTYVINIRSFKRVVKAWRRADEE